MCIYFETGSTLTVSMFLKPSNRTRIVYVEKHSYFDHSQEALQCNMMVSSNLIEIKLNRSHVAGKDCYHAKINLSGLINILHVSYCELILGFFYQFYKPFLGQLPVWCRNTYTDLGRNDHIIHHIIALAKQIWVEVS